MSWFGRWFGTLAALGGGGLPSTVDVGLSVVCEWDAPPANTARTFEVQFSTDSGYVTIVKSERHDGLMSGEKPTARLGGLAVDDQIWIRMRYIDELGQPGAWGEATAVVAQTFVSYNDVPEIVELDEVLEVVELE